MSYHYVGSELELFAGATNWKTYFGSVLRRFVVGRVLEVGAGIGSNIPYLHNDLVTEWIALEPDADLAIRIEERLAKGELPANCRLINGTTASVDSEALFDTILYIDVLEHILDDGAELVRSCGHLATGGHLVVLSPAHQYLFTPFDAAIGHHRRYDRSLIHALTPSGCTLSTCLMMDCAGLFASLANRVLLSAALPSRQQIAVWDKLLVPISRVLDCVIGYSFGKTIVAVWSPTA